MCPDGYIHCRRSKLHPFNKVEMASHQSRGPDPHQCRPVDDKCATWKHIFHPLLVYHPELTDISHGRTAPLSQRPAMAVQTTSDSEGVRVVPTHSWEASPMELNLQLLPWLYVSEINIWIVWHTVWELKLNVRNRGSSSRLDWLHERNIQPLVLGGV